jgi:hypothetical protein
VVDSAVDAVDRTHFVPTNATVPAASLLVYESNTIVEPNDGQLRYTPAGY